VDTVLIRVQIIVTQMGERVRSAPTSAGVVRVDQRKRNMSWDGL
jgi:hypothetical protein